MICQVCKKEIEKKVKRRRGTFCSEECFIISNVEQKDCWTWKRSKNSHGYCNIIRNGRYTSVHRFVYELHYGPVDENKMILHSCHNRTCVNPNHLRIGTHQENMQDMVLANRSQRGENHSRTHFKEIDIEAIFYLRKEGYKQKEIASIFDTTPATVCRILSGKRWKYFKQRKDDGVQREHSAAQ